MPIDTSAFQPALAAPYSEEEIKRRIQACPKLASLQSINRALGELVRSEQSLNSQIAEVIRRDPSLTARLHAGISGGFEPVDPVATDAWLALPGWSILYGADSPEANLARASVANSVRHLPLMLQGLL